ncbi:hypothetical protein N7535_000151 [Penicillium sp. DV-2018c]|nr:hypothetical protein N7535_000151 [Penicillium sp. DV-2018c]
MYTSLLRVRRTAALVAGHYESSYKETKRYPKSLAGTSKWHHIWEGIPFSDQPWGLLAGYPLTNEIHHWSVRDRYEWQADYRDPTPPISQSLTRRMLLLRSVTD